MSSDTEEKFFKEIAKAAEREARQNPTGIPSTRSSNRRGRASQANQSTSTASAAQASQATQPTQTAQVAQSALTSQANQSIPPAQASQATQPFQTAQVAQSALTSQANQVAQVTQTSQSTLPAQANQVVQAAQSAQSSQTFQATQAYQASHPAQQNQVNQITQPTQTAPPATTMAPPGNSQKRVKGTTIFRPFVYGTSAKLFDPETNPKPEGCPEEHTHSWTVFVKGVDDTDITYWCKKVLFKLHESIKNNSRMVENVTPGEPFQVHETGWGEFEITIKLYYAPESNEKPQTLYHHLRLHAYGDTDKQKQDMIAANSVTSWLYEEAVFVDPYESFYELLTTPPDRSKGAKGNGARVMKGGMVGSVGDRSVTLPTGSRPGQPFSLETQRDEIRRINAGERRVVGQTADLVQELAELKKKLEELDK